MTLIQPQIRGRFPGSLTSLPTPAAVAGDLSRFPRSRGVLGEPGRAFLVGSREVTATVEEGTAPQAQASEAMRRTGHPFLILGPLAERRVQWQLVNPAGLRLVSLVEGRDWQRAREQACGCGRAGGVRSPEEPLTERGSSTRDVGQGQGQT